MYFVRKILSQYGTHPLFGAQKWARTCWCQFPHDSLPFLVKTICVVLVTFGFHFASQNQLMMSTWGTAVISRVCYLQLWLQFPSLEWSPNLDSPIQTSILSLRPNIQPHSAHSWTLHLCLPRGPPPGLIFPGFFCDSYYLQLVALGQIPGHPICCSLSASSLI